MDSVTYYGKVTLVMLASKSHDIVFRIKQHVPIGTSVFYPMPSDDDIDEYYLKEIARIAHGLRFFIYCDNTFEHKNAEMLSACLGSKTTNIYLTMCKAW